MMFLITSAYFLSVIAFVQDNTELLYNSNYVFYCICGLQYTCTSLIVTLLYVLVMEVSLDMECGKLNFSIMSHAFMKPGPRS